MEKDNLDCGVTHKSKVSWNNEGKKDLCRTNGVDGRKPLAVTAQPVKLAALNQKHSKKAMPKGKKEIKSQILKKKKVLTCTRSEWNSELMKNDLLNM